MGGDFNDIRDHLEKQWGRQRAEGSFNMFRSFICDMQTNEVNFTGSAWTWTNNQAGDDYVEERLDRFFISSDWLFCHPKTVVNHIKKQSSDHCLLLFEEHNIKSEFTKHFILTRDFLTYQLLRKLWSEPS